MATTLDKIDAALNTAWNRGLIYLTAAPLLKPQPSRYAGMATHQFGLKVTLDSGGYIGL